METPWRLIIAAHDHHVVEVSERAAAALRVPAEVVNRRALPPARAGMVYCLGSRVVQDLPLIPGPCIVVCAGASVPDEGFMRVTSAAVVAVRLKDFNGKTLLDALLRLATKGHGASALLAFMRQDERIAKLPQVLLDAFLAEPGRMHTVDDLATAMGVSQKRVRQMVHAAGFPRLDHFFTTLRARAWSALGARNSQIVREYLGVKNVETFRRSCRRAGIPFPGPARENR